MIFIATLYRKLQIVKSLVRPLSKKHRLRKPFVSQHFKGSQSLPKGALEHFHQVLLSLWENLIWKISPLVICEIVVVFCNNLTANDNYPLRDCESSSSLIQMQLSIKCKLFSHFVVPFLESTLNCKHFEKAYVLHSYFFSEITNLLD